MTRWIDGVKTTRYYGTLGQEVFNQLGMHLREVVVPDRRETNNVRRLVFATISGDDVDTLLDTLEAALQELREPAK